MPSVGGRLGCELRQLIIAPWRPGNVSLGALIAWAARLTWAGEAGDMWERCGRGGREGGEMKVWDVYVEGFVYQGCGTEAWLGCEVEKGCDVLGVVGVWRS